MFASDGAPHVPHLYPFEIRRSAWRIISSRLRGRSSWPWRL